MYSLPIIYVKVQLFNPGGLKNPCNLKLSSLLLFIGEKGISLSTLNDEYLLIFLFFVTNDIN